MFEQIFTQLTDYLTQTGLAGLAIAAVLGLAIALFGYRMRLLFFFVVGFYVAAAVLGPVFASFIDVPNAVLIFGIIGGVVGGLVAVKLYYVALFLIGLLVGASVLAAVAESAAAGNDTVLIIAVVAGAVLGGVAAILLDKLAIVAGSAWAGGLHAAAAGATMLYRVIAMNQAAYFGIFIGLAIAFVLGGFLYQFRLLPSGGRDAYRSRHRRAVR